MIYVTIQSSGLYYREVWYKSTDISEDTLHRKSAEKHTSKEIDGVQQLNDSNYILNGAHL
jgi:hypothetical protein